MAVSSLNCAFLFLTLQRVVIVCLFVCGGREHSESVISASAVCLRQDINNESSAQRNRHARFISLLLLRSSPTLPFYKKRFSQTIVIVVITVIISPRAAMPFSLTLRHFSMLLSCIMVWLMGSSCIATEAASLPLDCKLTGTTYTTRSVQLNNTVQTATLAVFRGTSFYLDCLAFVVSNDAGTCSAAKVDAWALTTSTSTRKEVSRHPLTGDFLGPSVISTAYYYDDMRYIYLQMKPSVLPDGCNAITVAYTFSGYSSTTTPPIYSGATAAPFFATVAPNVVVRSTASELYFQLDKDEDVLEDRTYEFAYTSVIRLGGCQSLKSAAGTTSYIVSNGTNVPEIPGVGKLITNLAYVKWSVSFTASSYVMLCVRPASSGAFNYAGLLNVYSGNPAYSQITSLAPGSGITLNTPYVLTFVGTGFDLRTDSAKFASLLSFFCSVGRAAGGVPEAVGTLTPLNAVNSPLAYWNFTITIPGAYFVCYNRGGTWVAVPPYVDVVVNSRLLVTNVANALDSANAPAILYRSLTRTLTIELPSPPPTTMPPPTLMPVSSDAPPTDMPPVTTVTLTSTAAPVITTSTTIAPTTAAPTPVTTTTVAPSDSGSSGSQSDCTAQVDLPPQCPVLTNTVANTLHLILTVQFRVGALNATLWRGNLSSLLCIPRSAVAVYEMSNVEGSDTDAYLVIGLLCNGATTGSLPICNSGNVLSAVYCLGGTGEIISASADAAANATYEAQRDLLRSPALRILSAQDASSGISTANTTNHAAPSDDPVLSPSEVAIVSSTVVIAVSVSVGAVVLALMYRKRKFLRQQLGRLRPGEVFRRAIVIRVAQTTDMDDLARMGLNDEPHTVHGSPHATLEYPLLDHDQMMDGIFDEDLEGDGGSSMDSGATRTPPSSGHRPGGENPLSSLDRRKGERQHPRGSKQR